MTLVIQIAAGILLALVVLAVLGALFDSSPDAEEGGFAYRVFPLVLAGAGWLVYRALT